MLEHKSGEGSKFTSEYKVVDLMYFEQINGMQKAIDREKQFKNWHKDWKWNLIKEENSGLKDLADDWYSREEIENFISYK